MSSDNRSQVWLWLLFCLFTCLGFGTRLHGASYVMGWGNNYAGATQAPSDLTNAIAVSAGSGFTLALKTNGTVVGWGDNSLGQTSIPAGLSNVVAIAAGGGHSLALKSDGRIMAWGADNLGQSTVPAGLDNVVAVAAGDRHSLVLRADGTVYAWGYNSYGETTIPKGLSNVVAISTSHLHNIALKSDGTVVVWGDDPDWNAPPPGLSNVAAVSAGDEHNLALKSDGTVVAWGRNNTYGQQNVPAGLSNVVAIAVGSSHSLALKNDGTVVGWGYDLASTIPRGLTNVTAISAGGSHSIALNDGSPIIVKDPVGQTVYSGNGYYFSAQGTGLPLLWFQWRWNGTDLPGATNSWYWPTNLQVADSGEYQLVVSNLLGSVVSAPGILTVTSTVPIITKQPTNTAVGLGASPQFRVEVVGSLPLSFQWRFKGVNIFGATSNVLILPSVQLSNQGEYDVVVSNPTGTTISTKARLTVPSVWGQGYYHLSDFPPNSTNIISIAMAGSHSLALKSDGTVVACGYIGGNIVDVPPSFAGTRAVAIAAGLNHSLALKSDGTVTAWGLGTNDTGTGSSQGQSIVPAGLSNVIAIAAGNVHSLALKSDGTVVAWGAGKDILKFGTNSHYNQSIVPEGLSNVVAIAAGSFHSLALKSDGTIVAWGAGKTNSGTSPFSGQSIVPTGAVDVVSISAFGEQSLALRRNGTVIAWGNNGYGQSNVPLGLSNVVAIAAGDSHNLALREPGTVAAWGNNGYGQSALPFNLTNVVGIAGGIYSSLVLVNDGSPVIVRQPFPVTAYSGTSPFLSAGAVGPGISYQWQFNGSNIAGATRSTLVLSNVPPQIDGTFTVVVSNTRGSVTSSNVAVSVLLSPPMIVTQPSNQVALANWSITNGVTAIGSLPISYQWRLNGMNIPDATNAIFVVSNMQAEYSGNYDVVLSNAYGSIVSSNVPLTMVSSIVVGWGRNDYGQATVPAGLTNVVAVAVNGSGLSSPFNAEQSLALNADGTVVAWGRSGNEFAVPAGLSNVMAVAAGWYHNLALTSNGTVMTWGRNNFQQTNVPVGLDSVMQVAAGGQHSVALKNNGTVVAWGDNSRHQTNVPAGLTDVVAIAAGSYHSLALRSNGTVVAWGDGSFQKTNVMANLTNAVAIAAGMDYSLALKADGTIVAWGKTNAVSGLTNNVALVSGFNHAVALRRDGTLKAWGQNFLGETNVPPGLKDVVAIAAGADVNLALLRNPVYTPPVSVPVKNQTLLSVPILSKVGRNYQMEFKTSVISTGWMSLPLAVGNGGAMVITDPKATNAQRFYRIREW